MKTTLFVAVMATGLAMSAAPAFAGEGAGNPFPFRANGVTTRVQPGPTGLTQNPYVAQDANGQRGYDAAYSVPDQERTILNPRNRLAVR